MCKKNNVAVHDPIQETEEKIQRIFFECGGKTSILQFIIEIVILSCPILFCIFDNLEGKIFFHLSYCTLLLLIIMVLIYSKVIDNKISKIYVKKLQLKPEKTSIWHSFAVCCKKQGVTNSDLENTIELLKLDMNSGSYIKFIFSLFISCFVGFILNRLEEIIFSIRDLKIEQAENTVGIVVIMISLVTIMYLLSHKKEYTKTCLMKCLCHAKMLNKDK